MSIDLLASPSTSPLSLYRYRDGLYAADVLAAAIVEFDLFTSLAAQPSSLTQVCAHHGWHQRPADVLTTLCVARGYLRREGEVLHVSDVAREHLVADSPWSLAPYYAALKERPFVQDFVRVLRTGRPAGWGGATTSVDWHVAMEDEAFTRRFTAAMDCRGAYLGPALTSRLELAPHARVLDIGGGSGIYACALVARHPHLRATVLDQPPVDRIARTLIGERGYGSRVDVVACNFLNEPLPDGYDVHLFSNVLHDWDVDDVRRLLAASYRSLAPGGLLIIHDAFINAAKDGPVPVAEYSALLMHASHGKCYATSEYEALFDEVGFIDARYEDTVADRGVMVARRGSGPRR